MKKYKIEKILTRYTTDYKKETKTEIVKKNIKPSLSSLISMLEFARHNIKDWLCTDISVLVKERITGKWKSGVDISFVEDGDVLIIYKPMNKIDKTRSVIPECKFTLLSHLDYKKIKEKEMMKV